MLVMHGFHMWSGSWDLFENHFQSGNANEHQMDSFFMLQYVHKAKRKTINVRDAKLQLDCTLNNAKAHNLTFVCLHRLCKKRKNQKEAGTSMPQSRSSPSEHGSWSCWRHNWRSWIPQLTDSWSHSAQTLQRFSDHNKSAAKEKTHSVLLRCENTCSVASRFCTVAQALIC